MKDDPEPLTDNILVRRATKKDITYVYEILAEMERSAKERGTGIGKRSPQQLCQKIYDGKAIIALTSAGAWAGFSYFELWDEGRFISQSGLIVNPSFRKSGIAGRIKGLLFQTCRETYPAARLFSITTGMAVMKMNHDLDFEPVTYSELPREERFWNQCASCVNYPVLQSKDRKMCFCTAMLFDPNQHSPAGKNIVVKMPDTLSRQKFSSASLN